MTALSDSEAEPNTIILAPGSVKDIGEVCAEGAKSANVSAGPIRLLMGLPGKGGFGLLHISEPDRSRAIEGRGYSPPKAFVFEVARKWTHLHKGENGRLTVAVACAGGFNAIVLHWQDSFWSVVTALPFRRPKDPLFFEKERPDESEPRRALAARPRFETLTLPKPKGP